MADHQQTVLALEAGLDRDPEDWGLRLVLADALDDAGDPVGAFGQRFRWKYPCFR